MAESDIVNHFNGARLALLAPALMIASLGFVVLVALVLTRDA